MKEVITTNTKIVIECPIHGEFIQTINKHIYQKTGCPKCFLDRNKHIRTKSTEMFIKDAINTHGNRFDYSRTVYINAHTKVEVMCPEHGSFWITPANHILKYQGCPTCNLSGAEQVIRQYLIDHQIEFISQHKFDDCLSEKGRPLIFDFYIPSKNILIEYDGIYHYKPIDHGYGKLKAAENFQLQQRNDEIKNLYANKNRIRLLRIPFFQKKDLREFLDQYFHTNPTRCLELE